MKKTFLLSIVGLIILTQSSEAIGAGKIIGELCKAIGVEISIDIIIDKTTAFFTVSDTKENKEILKEKGLTVKEANAELHKKKYKTEMDNFLGKVRNRKSNHSKHFKHFKHSEHSEH